MKRSEFWVLSNRADRELLPLVDRHYSRKTPGAPQFVSPGRCLVLKTPVNNAVWVTSWPYRQYTHHDWAGAWVCSIFRNESPHLSSEMIRSAIGITRWKWPLVPDEGMITFVNRKKVRPKKNPGYCFEMAGFSHVGYTKSGLITLHLGAGMPEPEMPMDVLF